MQRCVQKAVRDISYYNKDENTHRFALSGELLERKKEREGERERERKREKEKEREKEREQQIINKI